MAEERQQSERFSMLQTILDEPIVLLFLGVAIFVIFYLTWGLIEVSNVPQFPEELKSVIMGGQ